MSEVILRRFARDQWVRLHGTPRVTVLIGGEGACEVWQRWLAAGALDGLLVEGEIDTALQDAAARAAVSPATPIAIACSPAALQAWRAGRRDRLAAMVDEGAIEIPDTLPDLGGVGSTTGAIKERTLDGARGSTTAPSASAIGTLHRNATSIDSVVRPTRRRRSHMIDARSVAEAALFEAFEATPATAGRFELNEYLSVYFRPRRGRGRPAIARGSHRGRGRWLLSLHGSRRVPS